MKVPVRKNTFLIRCHETNGGVRRYLTGRMMETKVRDGVKKKEDEVSIIGF